MPRDQSPQNLALIVSSISPTSQTVRLHQAIHAFTLLLSKEERTDYDNARKLSSAMPFDIPGITKDIEAKLDRQKKRYVGRFWNFFQVVRGITSVVDMIVGGSQSEIACSVWAIVRFTLQVIATLLCASKGELIIRRPPQFLHIWLQSRRFSYQPVDIIR